MDLINMTNKAQIREFYNQVRENFYFSSPSFEIYYLLGGGCQQKQNFSLLSPELRQLGKKHGDMECEKPLLY